MLIHKLRFCFRVQDLSCEEYSRFLFLSEKQKPRIDLSSKDCGTESHKINFVLLSRFLFFSRKTETSNRLVGNFILKNAICGSRQYSLVDSVAFSPDGNTLASGSSDHTVILWDVNPESWLKQLCYIANRNFSQKEWREYMGEQRPFEKTCPDLSQDTLGALQHIKQGKKLAKEGKIDAAVMEFKEAQKLDARYMTVDPEMKAKQIFALNKEKN